MRKRSELLHVLENVSGALAEKDAIPALVHFWFTGKEVVAYDAQIAISTKLKTGITGGVSKSLLDLVKVTQTEFVDFQTDEKHKFEIKFGNESKKEKKIIWRKPDTLAMLNQETPFDMPAFDAASELQITDMPAFITAIKSCMRSCNASIAAPEFLGVTLIANGTQIEMYATDNKSLSIEQVSVKKAPKFKRVIISAPFCKQLVSLASKDKVRITINEEYSLADIDGGDTILFGNLVGERDSPMDFKRIIDTHVPSDYAKYHVKVPERLRQAIDRAVIITGETSSDEAETTAIVKDDFLYLESVSQALGKVSDKIKLSGKHPDVKLTIQCKALQNDLANFTNMFISKNCWIMMNGTSMYIVSGI